MVLASAVGDGLGNAWQPHTRQDRPRHTAVRVCMAARSPSSPTPVRGTAAARLCLRPLYCRHIRLPPPVMEDTRKETRIDAHDTETLAGGDETGVRKVGHLRHRAEGRDRTTRTIFAHLALIESIGSSKSSKPLRLPRLQPSKQPTQRITPTQQCSAPSPPVCNTAAAKAAGSSNVRDG